MYKRIITGIVTSSLFIGLIGCGGAGSDDPNASVAPTIKPSPSTIADLLPEEDAVLTVWDSYEEKAFIESVAAKFNELYDVRIRFAEVNPDKAMEQLAIEGPVGMGADVLASNREHIELAVSKKLLRPIDLYKSMINKQSLSEAVQGASYKGVLYGFPASQNVAAVYYNKDLIDLAPKNWSDLIEFANDFNDPIQNKYAIVWDVGSPYWNYGFFGGYGFHLFGKKGTAVSQYLVNGQAGVRGGDYFRSLRDAILPLRTEVTTKSYVQQAFIAQRAAMVISDTTDAVLFKSKMANVATAPLPNLPGNQAMKPFSSIKSYYINANTEFPNAARLFASFLTSAEQQRLNFSMTGAIPTNESVFEDSAIQNDPIASGFIQQLENAKSLPGVDEIDAYLESMEVAIATMWNDQTDAKTALTAAVEDMKTRLK